MAPQNAVLSNFAAGETSPKSRGRFDLAWYAASCRQMLNFIADIQGPARFRPGFQFAALTRQGQRARLVPFSVSSGLAYMLEFTPGFMRVYKNEQLLTKDPNVNAATTVSGITNAAQGVVTVNAITGIANGDELIITGLVGMPQLNGRQVLVANVSGSTFKIKDPVSGAYINTTAFGAYASGGSVKKVYEIASPYLAGELDDISFSPPVATGTFMYFAHPRYVPYKLSVGTVDNFTLATYARTADPFVAAGPAGTVVSPGVDIAAVAVVYFNLSFVVNTNALYKFTGLVGTTQLNNGVYRLEPFSSAGGVLWCRLRDPVTNATVDSSGWSAWVSGGTATVQAEYPIAVGFYEGRLFFFGSNQRPNVFFGSRLPDNTGATRYDDFTAGANADDGVVFALAPVNGQLNYIVWGRGTSKFLFLGTLGGPFRVSGAGLDQPITPSSINVRQFDGFGCEAAPAVGGEILYYLQRGGLSLRTIRVVNVYTGDFASDDLAVNAEHMAYSLLHRPVFQLGRPDALWSFRDDGSFVGVSVHGNENVAGWHRHKMGGVGRVLDLQVLGRPTKFDRLWAVVQRTVNGTAQCTVEMAADDVAFPDFEDFYSPTVDDDEAAQLAAQTAAGALFKNALYRRQEGYRHLDCCMTYDGSARGLAAGAMLTPGAASGAAVVFTASQNVFVAADVGTEIWKKPDPVTGVGAGRAVITSVADAQHATAKITVPFDSVSAIAAGAWHIATTVLYNLWPFEGQQVAVVSDGAVLTDGRAGSAYPALTVANGTLTLPRAMAYGHVGFAYAGILETQNLEIGARNGPVQAKPRNITEVYIRFMNTLGAKFGTDLYHLERVPHLSDGDRMDRPTPIFSGIRRVPYNDEWGAEQEKRALVVQDLPLPCSVLFLDLRFDVVEDD